MSSPPKSAPFSIKAEGSPAPRPGAVRETAGLESPSSQPTRATTAPRGASDQMCSPENSDGMGAMSADDVQCISPPRNQASLRAPVPKGGDSRSSGADPEASSSRTSRPTATIAAPAKPKRMLQATLAFSSEGTAVTEERLRKELAERDTRIEELVAELATTRASLSNQSHGIDETTHQLGEAETRMGRYQEAMKALMVETARTHRRDARRWQHQQHFELGHIASMPNPVNGMTEVWVEGNTARRLINELNDIQIRQREVEARKPAKSRRGVAAAAAAAAADDDDANGFDVEEEAEMRKMELASLRAAEQEVQMKRAQYKQDIDAFVKEVRRIHDEDASSFALCETIGRVSTAADAGGNSSTSNLPAAPSGLTTAHSASAADGAGIKHEERYVLLHLLGRGGFSEVWKAFDLTEGRYVACKVHKVNRQWSAYNQRKYLEHAERELDIQRQLDHPRLMKLYDVFEYDSTTFVSVMEFSAGEDLERRLKRVRSFRESEARLIMMQVLSALRHLADQAKPIIHYDLKPANIIFHSSLASCLEVKVTDFGLSKIIHSNNGSNDPSVELTSQQCGTFYYLPPECFGSNAVITPKVDIWACGIIFYQMLYGKRPFASDASQADIYNNKLIVLHARKGVEFPPKPSVSNEAKEIIRRCLTYDVAQRPDILTLCNESYFTRRGTAKRGRSSAISSGSAMMAAPRTESGTSSPVAGVMPPPA